MSETKTTPDFPITGNAIYGTKIFRQPTYEVWRRSFFGKWRMTRNISAYDQIMGHANQRCILVCDNGSRCGPSDLMDLFAKEVP